MSVSLPPLNIIQPKFELDYLNLYKNVNRLILIGNGFDLAHGLKSSFAHFINYYLNEVLSIYNTSGQYEDKILEIKYKNIETSISFAGRKLSQLTPVEEFINFPKTHNVIINWKSNFFHDIVNDVYNKNWVDIEVIYFDLLAKAVELHDRNLILRLNEEIEFIRDKLITYLQKEQNSFVDLTCIPLLNQIKSRIRVKECLINTIKKDLIPSSLYFLNFNYTNLAEMYIKAIDHSFAKLNYIHGCLKPESGNGQLPIFGFGDELDKKYLSFEEGRSNEPFEHIKSFKYLESNNYRNLLEFIESNPFQVHIYGHSCGISDRTMLNGIFEHSNCISIKPYYYTKDGKNDYTQKNYSISRHFKDKTLLRSKVVNFKYCEPMVQPLD